MDLSKYQFLEVKRAGEVVTVALNRPEILNGIHGEMEIELCDFFTNIHHDKDTAVVVLTGTGKAFSGGGDFDYIRQAMDEPERFYRAMNYGKRLVFSMLDCSKPLVAKINGHAIGLGASIALLCDVTFAAESAKISDPHVAIGFVAGDGGAVMWPQLIGFNRAKEYLLTGEAMSAKHAEELGLINHAVPDAELDAAVEVFVNKVLAMPRHAVQWTKATINIGLKQIAHSTMDASMAYEALSNSTQEHRLAFEQAFKKIKK